MKLEIRNISIASLITSSVPIVVCAWGALGGLVTFMVVPSPQIEPMSIGAKILSVGFYALIYAVVTAAAIVFIAFIYNILTSVLGMKGLTFDLEEISDQE